MSTSEILAQLPSLTAADREQIRTQLDAIDAAVRCPRRKRGSSISA